jgi:hypothetical protein
MKRLSDIVTVSLGAAALVTLVYAKDRPTPTPGVRTAIQLIGYAAGSHAQVSTPPSWKAPPNAPSGKREVFDGGALS